MGVVANIVHSSSSAKATIERTPKAPRFPCETCGKETKNHHPKLNKDGSVAVERRICSDKNCRVVTETS